MNTNDGINDRTEATDGSRWLPEYELDDGSSYMIFTLTHPDSDGTIEAWSKEEPEETVLRRVRDLEDGKPGRVAVDLMFFYQACQPDDAYVLGWDGPFGTATIVQVKSSNGPRTELELDAGELASLLSLVFGKPLQLDAEDRMAVGPEPKRRPEDDFELLRLVFLLAAPSFERFVDDLPDVLETAGRVTKVAKRIAREHPAPPRLPVDRDEFLERLRHPDAVVWALELKQFLKMRKMGNLKEHLVRAGIIDRRRHFESFRTTSHMIMSRFVPYVQGMRTKREMFFNFEGALQEAGLIPPPELPPRTR